MRRAYLTVVRGAALLPVRGAMELKSDEATNPSRYRPRAPDGRRDAPPKGGELMAKSDNRCANCGGRFGSCLPLPLGAALLPQSLQSQLPCENSQGPCAHETMVRLVGSRGRVSEEPAGMSNRQAISRRPA